MSVPGRLLAVVLLAASVHVAQAQEYGVPGSRSLMIKLDKALLDIDSSVKWVELSTNSDSLKYSVTEVYESSPPYRMDVSGPIRDVLMRDGGIAMKHVYPPLRSTYADFSTTYLLVFGTDCGADSAHATLSSLAGVVYVHNVKEANDFIDS